MKLLQELEYLINYNNNYINKNKDNFILFLLPYSDKAIYSAKKIIDLIENINISFKLFDADMGSFVFAAETLTYLYSIRINCKGSIIFTKLHKLTEKIESEICKYDTSIDHLTNLLY